MSFAAQGSAASSTPGARPAGPVASQRSRLLDAMRSLEASSAPDALRRVALAEAEFRLAILAETDPQESIERLQRAIGHDPFHPKFFFHLGRLLHRGGDLRSALHEYRRALALAPASHRTYAHLALALLELEEAEKNIGRAILEALARGAEEELKQQLAELDGYLAAKLEERKKAPPPAKRKADAAKAAEDGPPSGSCRWRGVWRLSLIDHLTRAKLIRKQIDRHLTLRTRSPDGHAGAAEFATACLFLLYAGEPTGEVAALLEGQALKSLTGHPAAAFFHAAVALARSENPEQFADRAADELAAGHLPPQLVCCLHYLRYGPDSSLPAAVAVRLLDRYPPSLQRQECFRELRLAVLDGYARRAWSEDQLEQARLLWRETVPLDPTHIAVAHNLALVAARMRSTAEYGPAWERAVELRYLHAAGAGDVRLHLEDRRTLHLALAAQGRQRHCKAGASSQQPPRNEELLAWIADREALDVWLSEWDLYYLNSRLGFRSPVHLLGIPRDAPPQVAAGARDMLIRQIDGILRSRSWSGIRTFCQLAEELIEKSAELAADFIAVARDPYFEDENPQADALTQEAIDRGFLLYRMITLLIQQAPGADLAAGSAMARRLLALPWKVLAPLCAERGLIEKDLDLVKAFEDAFVSLMAACSQEPPSGPRVSALLSALEEAVAVVPHRAEPRLVRCQVQLQAGKNCAAYASAVEALDLIVEARDEEADRLRRNLAVCIDNAAFGEMPERLREPTNREEAAETLSAGSKVLQGFPHAGGLRFFLASLMLQMGDRQRVEEAVKLLETGIGLAIHDEQARKLGDLLAQAQSQTKTAGVMEEVKNLLEAASKRVATAVQEINRGATDNSLKKGRKAVTEAIREAERAEELARKAGLDEARQQSAALVRKFKEIQQTLSAA